MAKTYLSYLTLPINLTPVILRMTTGHPYGKHSIPYLPLRETPRKGSLS